jgi:hypothetical protein
VYEVFAVNPEITIVDDKPLPLSVQLVVPLDEYWYLLIVSDPAPVIDTGIDKLVAAIVTVPIVGAGGRVILVVDDDVPIPLSLLLTALI